MNSAICIAMKVVYYDQDHHDEASVQLNKKNSSAPKTLKCIVIVSLIQVLYFSAFQDLFTFQYELIQEKSNDTTNIFFLNSTNNTKTNPKPYVLLELSVFETKKLINNNQSIVKNSKNNELMNNQMALSAQNGNNNFTYDIQQSKVHSVDVVIELSGELGNHLHKIAAAYALQYIAQEYNFPVKFKYHYLPQNHQKSKQPAKEMQACFINFHSTNFKECNHPSYEKIVSQQDYFYGNGNKTKLYLKNHYSSNDSSDSTIVNIRNMIQFILDSMNNEERSIPFHQLQSILNDTNILPLNIPFIIGNSFSTNQMIDRYQDQIQDLFRFNYASSQCCKLKAEPNETVVHVRGFLTEAPGIAKRSPNYRELDAKRTARELLGHLQPGDKVALLSRFPKILQGYKNELEKRGLKVRIISGQTGIQDFCFLMSAEREIVAMLSSTFALFAAFLSPTVKNITLYRTAGSLPEFFNSKYASINFPLYDY